MLNLCN